MLSHDLVRHLSCWSLRVATRLQVPAPERLAELPAIHEQMVRRLPLNRLHDAARSKMGRDAQRRWTWFGRTCSFKNPDVVRPTDFSNQISDPRRHASTQDRARDTS